MARGIDTIFEGLPVEDKRPVAVRFLEPRRHRLVQSIQRSPRPRFNQLLHRSNLLFRLSRVDLVHQDSAEAGQQAAGIAALPFDETDQSDPVRTEPC